MESTTPSEYVAVRRCDGYRIDAIRAALREGLAVFGGMEQIFGAAQRIAVKVNLLTPAAPEKAITTHPAVAAAVCLELAESGRFPFIVDSPGAGTPFTQAGLARTYKACGYDPLFEELGIELNRVTDAENISISGRRIKRLDILSAVHGADAVVSVAKAKTHGFTHVTGTVKNLFGVVPGLFKAGYHAKLRQLDHFAEMLVDVAEYVNPLFCVLDAITCMEGNGPSAGQPREVGALLMARNPHACDKVFADMIGLPLAQNPVLQRAIRRGCVVPDRIAIDGPPCGVPGFRLPETTVTAEGFVAPSLLFRLFRPLFRHVTLRPAIMKNCVGCGVCERSCPVHAITIRDGRAEIDYRKCIRCYCCHEMCPHNAICFKKGAFHKLLTWLSKHV